MQIISHVPLSVRVLDVMKKLLSPAEPSSQFCNMVRVENAKFIPSCKTQSSLSSLAYHSNISL